MNEDTIVAVYDTAAHAEAAAAALRSAGIPDRDISLHAGSRGGTGATGTATTTTPVREQGFWSSLLGGETDHDTAVYDRSIETGSTVVSVKVPDTRVDEVMEILESHHPIDIDERAAGYGLTQTTSATQQPIGVSAASVPVTLQPTTERTTMAARTGEESLQLSEERLAVGKRVVNRGGTRIRRYVVETPVEESVTLHDEKVVLERRPVTDERPVGEFTDKTIEMTETTEEAVVSKTARVYEEVGLRKEATDRVETIRDTVRKEEAEVEQIPGTVTPPREPKI